MAKFFKRGAGGSSEPSQVPMSLMGEFYLSGLLNRERQRDEFAGLAKRRIPVDNPERGVLIGIILEMLIGRCFTREPDEATIRRFVDYMFAEVRESDAPNPELACRLVRFALRQDGIPECSSPVDGPTIAARVALSMVIAIKYSLGEAEVSDVIVRAEARAVQLGVHLTPSFERPPM